MTYNTTTYGVLKKLSITRITEANVLLNKRFYSGAYYLAGLSVELALKACYAKTVKRYSFPPDRAIYERLYTHNLPNLLSISGLKNELDQGFTNNKRLEVNWAVTKDWSVNSRYQLIKKTDAFSIYQAINDQADGILTWIKKRW